MACGAVCARMTEVMPAYMVANGTDVLLVEAVWFKRFAESSASSQFKISAMLERQSKQILLRCCQGAPSSRRMAFR